MTKAKAPSRPNMGRRYRPAPPPRVDHRYTLGRRKVFYARTTTLEYREVVPDEPIILRDAWSFATYFDWCYGVAIVADPRDFIPDTFVSSRSQVLEWQAAVTAVERGLIPMSPRDYPKFLSPWGIGINLIRKEVA